MSQGSQGPDPQGGGDGTRRPCKQREGPPGRSCQHPQWEESRASEGLSVAPNKPFAQIPALSQRSELEHGEGSGERDAAGPESGENVPVRGSWGKAVMPPVAETDLLPECRPGVSEPPGTRAWHVRDRDHTPVSPLLPTPHVQLRGSQTGRLVAAQACVTNQCLPESLARWGVLSNRLDGMAVGTGQPWMLATLEVV